MKISNLLLRYNIIKSVYYSMKWCKRPFCVRVGYSVRIDVADGGTVRISDPHTVIRIERNSRIEVRGGLIFFTGSAFIGEGTSILAACGGKLIIGDGFSCTGRCDIGAFKQLTIKDHVMMSVNCHVMDYDMHVIEDELGNEMNAPMPVSIGERVWIGSYAVVLKGAQIPDNVIIGSHSVVSSQNMESNYIYAGNPVKQIKRFGCWKN